MSERADDELMARIFRQRRRIRTRLLSTDKWPLAEHDATELQAINMLFADVEKAMSLPPDSVSSIRSPDTMGDRSKI